MLNKKGITYTDAEVEKLRDLMYLHAGIAYRLILKKMEGDITGNSPNK
jgi:hypothetical protein